MNATFFWHWHIFPLKLRIILFCNLQLRASMIEHYTKQIKKQEHSSHTGKIDNHLWFTYGKSILNLSPGTKWYYFYTSWRLMSKRKHSYAGRSTFSTPATRCNVLSKHAVHPTFCLPIHPCKCLHVAPHGLNMYITQQIILHCYLPALFASRVKFAVYCDNFIVRRMIWVSFMLQKEYRLTRDGYWWTFNKQVSTSR